MNLEPIIRSEVTQKEKYKYCILAHYMEFKKMIPMVLLVGQQRRHRHKEQTFGLNGKRIRWDDLKE